MTSMVLTMLYCICKTKNYILIDWFDKNDIFMNKILPYDVFVVTIMNVYIIGIAIHFLVRIVIKRSRTELFTRCAAWHKNWNRIQKLFIAFQFVIQIMCHLRNLHYLQVSTNSHKITITIAPLLTFKTTKEVQWHQHSSLAICNGRFDV